MKSFMNSIGWAGLAACSVVAGCAMESGGVDGEAPDSVASKAEQLNPAYFGGWLPIPTPSSIRFKYGAAISSLQPQERRIFAVNDANSHMMAISWSSSFGWSGWGDLSGEFNSKPATVSWVDPSFTGHTFVVSKGKNDNRYWFATTVGASFSGWSTIPTGIFDSAPTAARLINKLVVCGRAGPQIWCATNPLVGSNLTSWTAWVKAVPGSVFGSDPAVASNLSGSGTLRLIGRNPGGSYWASNSTDGVNWSSFTQIPNGSFLGGAGISGRQSAFDYFGQGNDSAVYQKTDSEAFFQQLTPATVTSPNAFAWSNNHVDVVGLEPLSKLVVINTWQGP